MTRIAARLVSSFLLLSIASIASTQSPQLLNTRPPQITAVPNMLKFNGTARDGRGELLSGVLGMTFALYATEDGGAALWRETQNVTADRNGQYAAALGLTSAEGIPTGLFTSGEARWLSVQVDGQPEERRILLLSVPYALKAKDSETLGGLPASAFVRADGGGSASGTTTIEAPSVSGDSIHPYSTPAGGGLTNYVPLWTSTTNLGTSSLFQSGIGSGAKLGVNTVTPGTTLDVNGSGTFRGTLLLPGSGTATSSTGVNSQLLGFVASAFNSSSLSALNQAFLWRAEPTGNNTTAPGATLNLLFGAGAAIPTETGLKIAKNGIISFAPGQTFPGGSGSGTISGVTAGTGLIGGGTSGAVKLNVDATKVPFLASTNTFTQPQVIYAVGNGVTVNATATAIVGKGSNGILGIATGTGGSANGVQGQSVNATAVRGDDSGAGTGLVGTSSTGFGVYGFSLDGTAVYGVGASQSGISINPSAVVGDATNINGVTGVSTNGSGVVAVNRHSGFGLTAANQGSGIGIYSAAATIDKDDGVGIRGESFGTKVSQNGGPDGVQGITHSALGSGVAGINDAYAGIGVYGISTNNGFGFETPSHVSQGRGAGGWVKAMAFVDPFASGGIAIVRCFNSQQTGAAVYTAPCGMSVTHNGLGVNTIDFGFAVNDRFIHVDSQLYHAWNGSNTVFRPTITLATTFSDEFLTLPASQAYFQTAYLPPGVAGSNPGDLTDDRFTVIVY